VATCAVSFMNTPPPTPNPTATTATQNTMTITGRRNASAVRILNMAMMLVAATPPAPRRRERSSPSLSGVRWAHSSSHGTEARAPVTVAMRASSTVKTCSSMAVTGTTPIELATNAAR
jgi:hypothetical protein